MGTQAHYTRSVLWIDLVHGPVKGEHRLCFLIVRMFTFSSMTSLAWVPGFSAALSPFVRPTLSHGRLQHSHILHSDDGPRGYFHPLQPHHGSRVRHRWL